VPLHAGAYYLIVASFEQITGYFYQHSIAPYPIPTSFGELTGGAGFTWSPFTAFPPGPIQDVQPEAFGEPVAYYQTLVTDGVVKWTSLAPASGTVGRGASMDVVVQFTAAGLLPDGDHQANIRISSNDPETPEIVVPASVHVASAADISLSRNLLDYGQRFLGATVKDTLVVSNFGTQALHVTGIASSRPQYTVDVSDFTLAPDAHRNVVVTFATGATGAFPATLTVISDDPDESAVIVTLEGQSVEPPAMLVSPRSMSGVFPPGAQATRNLLVTNSGESDLSYHVEIENLDGSPSPGIKPEPRRESLQATRREIMPAQDNPHSDASAVSYSGKRSRLRHVEIPSMHPSLLSAAPTLKVLILHSAFVSEIRALLMTFPDIATVDEFNAAVATPALTTLLQYDAVLLIIDFPLQDTNAAGDVLADYVEQGGGVVMTLASFITGFEVGGRFITDGYYPLSPGTGPEGSAGLAGYDPAHPIMAGVQLVFGDLLGNTILEPGAQWVANWDNDVPFIATQGERIAAINVYVGDGGYWFGDIPLILHNALSWAAGAGWLRAEPAQGVVAAHSSANIALVFDTNGVLEGSYSVNLRVAGNDPRTPEVMVPINLLVDSTLVTAVNDPGAIPARYALLPNRPNPFNPTTTIAYDLPSSARVRLVIYDVSGKQVKNLVSTTKPAGRHSAVWDGRNDASELVASGVYFYRLMAGDFVQTKKMVLLK
jgi:hypothetical protein